VKVQKYRPITATTRTSYDESSFDFFDSNHKKSLFKGGLKTDPASRYQVLLNEFERSLHDAMIQYMFWKENRLFDRPDGTVPIRDDGMSRSREDERKLRKLAAKQAEAETSAIMEAQDKRATKDIDNLVGKEQSTKRACYTYKMFIDDSLPDSARRLAETILSEIISAQEDEIHLLKERLFDLFIQQKRFRELTKDFNQLETFEGAPDSEGAMDWGNFRIETTEDLLTMHKGLKYGLPFKKKPLVENEDNIQFQGIKYSKSSFDEEEETDEGLEDLEGDEDDDEEEGNDDEDDNEELTEDDWDTIEKKMNDLEVDYDGKEKADSEADACKHVRNHPRVMKDRHSNVRPLLHFTSEKIREGYRVSNAAIRKVDQPIDEALRSQALLEANFHATTDDDFEDGEEENILKALKNDRKIKSIKSLPKKAAAQDSENDHEDFENDEDDDDDFELEDDDEDENDSDDDVMESREDLKAGGSPEELFSSFEDDELRANDEREMEADPLAGGDDDDDDNDDDANADNGANADADADEDFTFDDVEREEEPEEERDEMEDSEEDQNKRDSIMDFESIQPIVDRDGRLWSGVLCSLDMIHRLARGQRSEKYRAFVVIGNGRGSAGYGVSKSQTEEVAINGAAR
jgi:hypothetical protein